MTAIETMSILRSIIDKAGLADILSIGNYTNESADIMWFSSKEKIDYFAVYDKPLFQFSCIENITYKYSKEGDCGSVCFYYANDLCILRFHLKGECSFLIECDDDGVLNLYFNDQIDDNGKWISSETEDFKALILGYVLAIEKQQLYADLIKALFYNLENRTLDSNLCEKQHHIIFDYILNNAKDNDVLFLYAFESALYISSDYKEYPYLKDIIGFIKKRGLLDEFFVYIRKKCLEDYSFKDHPEIYNDTLLNITENVYAHIDNANESDD